MKNYFLAWTVFQHLLLLFTYLVEHWAEGLTLTSFNKLDAYDLSFWSETNVIKVGFEDYCKLVKKPLKNEEIFRLVSGSMGYPAQGLDKAFLSHVRGFITEPETNKFEQNVR